MVDAVGETLQVLAAEPHCNGDGDDGSKTYKQHVTLHCSPELAPHVTAESLADGDALGVLAAVVGAHGDKAEEGNQHRKHHEQLDKAHGRFDRLKTVG